MNICPFCGADVEQRFIFTCPKCNREGCPECIPAGKGTLCQQCEEDEERDSNNHTSNK